ncbi:hypothetical protein [Mucilaginibacter polytrichastri]|uniref:Uncharacterized protein n=1 Tax=Mucilaginibacter polytrichastri TaxID=1302689 RepID=A0A1Q5ZWN1_9SPHI|nr:hypothetical protein [Mucilaginibacter polytrichastri]OKS86108.1 hypothetical protein RG47T_1558 [Mucilaginibacter polytrichastri]SFS58672.1 hypothetical protein SAMN04487890_10233 [Mucilaginibacter polytrichastri]
MNQEVFKVGDVVSHSHPKMPKVEMLIIKILPDNSYRCRFLTTSHALLSEVFELEELKYPDQRKKSNISVLSGI